MWRPAHTYLPVNCCSMSRKTIFFLIAKNWEIFPVQHPLNLVEFTNLYDFSAHQGSAVMLNRSLPIVTIILVTHVPLSAQDTPQERSPLIGTKFAQIRSETLAGTKLTLPDDARGKITLITIAFKHGTQQQLDSWLTPFAEAFGTKSGFTFYEIPMLTSDVKPFAFRIDSGMRSGIPEEKHKNVMTYYGDYEEYLHFLHIDDITLGYAFLLDQDGIIRWQGEGFATEEMTREMIHRARELEQKQ